MNWKIQTNPYNWDLKDLGISHILGQVLANRKLTEAHAKCLITDPITLFENPYNIINAEKAATAIMRQIQGRKPIYVFADYDVDGMTSGYVITNFLRRIGGNVTPYYPERSEHYGINVNFAKRIIEDKIDESPMVITVDNGITALEPISMLSEAGVEVIVLDHHQPGDELPNCLCCNPWIDKKHGTHLAGVGVVWKICQIIEHKAEKLSGRTLNMAERYAPFVGLGTISDVMPMTLENRAIVKMALDKINNKESEVFNAMKRVFSLDSITSKDMAWQIAPKLNSCSRLGHTKLPAHAFYLDDTEQLEDALTSIGRMDTERKKITKKATKEAIENYDYSNDVVCFYDASMYPPGISGIIAGKLSEEFNKPAVVYTIQEGTNTAVASCRSNTFDIKMLLSLGAEEGLLNYAAGHSCACGAELIADKIEELKRFLKMTVGQLIIDGKLKEEEKVLTIDKSIDIKDMTYQLLSEIQSIPYGNNEEPVFVIEKVTAIAIEPFANKDHLVLRLRDKEGNIGYAIGWYMKSLYEEHGKPDIIDVAGTLELAKFSARSLNLRYNDVVMMIKDIRRRSN